MDETPQAGDSNLDHRRLVARHRNVFEPDPPTKASEEDVASGSGDTVDRSRRTISSDAGKPCILGAKCRCICEHYHEHRGDDNINTPKTAYTEAHVTASHDHCPEAGHGLSD